MIKCGKIVKMPIKCPSQSKFKEQSNRQPLNKDIRFKITIEKQETTEII